MRKTAQVVLIVLAVAVVLACSVFALPVSYLSAVGIKTWIVQPFYIPSSTMRPTLETGDRVLVSKSKDANAGDIVVFVAPGDRSLDLIKRVMAVGGQTVTIRDGLVAVDGKNLDEPYVLSENRDNYTLPQEVRVPDGYVWVMGDNRASSSDSRVFGPVPVADILGRATSIYWPPSRMRFF